MSTINTACSVLSTSSSIAEAASTGTVQAIATSPEELDMELTDADITMVHDFEDSWKEFMMENPNLTPFGKKRTVLNQLQREVLATLQSKQAVEAELKRQLEFFQESRDALEQHYGEQSTIANNYQTKIHKHLQDQLDKVSLAKAYAQQTIAWNHFLNCVDKVIPQPTGVENPDRMEKTFKPSARAMALINPSGDADDVCLRAYRLDHALLTVQRKMLLKELERQDLLTTSLETVGKLLSEHNIWGLLNKQQQEQASK